ncbi:MAG: acyl-[acyl-carrier-protein]--UDP-N-acetylglucosamine O-acyltransferase [Gammaproteobacteria bacterium HGW-Gammaproteobacteria-1]|jgi:UDP-N-acetylglucosamine acyltransferase|nr:MAG: acyl-[acyl-carrier-protein]--UDP-N-acetylglucosamine O-acyltransferase [Gammaproteobacteria bacterium HGW-Gammaproteobacteria-1]
MNIHPTAIVDPQARVGAGVSIGAYSIIGAGVEIGDGTWIGPHVVINGPTRIGRDNKIHQFASLGEAPQDKKYNGEPTELVIGDRNIIREYVTMNRGTPTGGGVTRVGNDGLFMAYIHIAHDCQIGDRVIFSNNASLAGHVHVGDQVILSGFTLVHQFCSIGAHAFTGMGSGISKDVPPYLMVAGNPAEPHGINKEGLKRRGFSPQSIQTLRQAYKVLYRSGLSLEEATVRLKEMAETCDELKPFVEFMDNSKRSIVR